MLSEFLLGLSRWHNARRASPPRSLKGHSCDLWSTMCRWRLRSPGAVGIYLSSSSIGSRRLSFPRSVCLSLIVSGGPSRRPEWVFRGIPNISQTPPSTILPAFQPHFQAFLLYRISVDRHTSPRAIVYIILHVSPSVDSRPLLPLVSVAMTDLYYLIDQGSLMHHWTLSPP